MFAAAERRRERTNEKRAVPAADPGGSGRYCSAGADRGHRSEASLRPDPRHGVRPARSMFVILNSESIIPASRGPLAAGTSTALLGDAERRRTGTNRKRAVP